MFISFASYLLSLPRLYCLEYPDDLNHDRKLIDDLTTVPKRFRSLLEMFDNGLIRTTYHPTGKHSW